MRTSIRVCATAIGLAASALAFAHAHLESSDPANGASLTTAPSAIKLTFSEAAKLTTCWLQKETEAKQKLACPTDTAAQVVVKVPTLTPGSYVFGWRAMGDDGHVMPGQIKFAVAASGQN